MRDQLTKKSNRIDEIKTSLQQSQATFNKQTEVNSFAGHITTQNQDPAYTHKDEPYVDSQLDLQK